MQRTVKNLLWVSGGFVGGVLAGYHLSEKKNREWIARIHQELNQYLGRAEKQGKKISSKGIDRLNRLNTMLKHELLHPVPDLYKATGQISLELDEIDLGDA